MLLTVAALITAVDLRLVGVVVSRTPQRSSALIAGEGRTRVATPGESVFGARLVSVSEDRVVLEFDGRREELGFSRAAAHFGSPAGPEAGTAEAPRPAPPSAPPAVAGVEPPRTLDRADVERRMMQEIPRILAETALLPVSDEGRVIGFSLTRLPADSLLTDIGLEPGDVLTEINGSTIDSMATLAALYGRLRGENEIRAVVLRGGSSRTLSVRLR